MKRERVNRKNVIGHGSLVKKHSIKRVTGLYVFVDMKGSAGEPPSVFIVPSNDVVDFLGSDPEEWSIPSFLINLNEKDRYLERWDIIEKLLK